MQSPFAHDWATAELDLSLDGNQQDNIDRAPFYTSPSNLYLTPESLVTEVSPPSLTSAQEETDVHVLISTSFCPGVNGAETNLIFSSSDGVLFYLNSKILQRVEPSAFGTYTFSGESEIHKIPEPSAVLNIILHTLYGTSCAQNSPSLDEMVKAVDRMPFYQITPQKHLVSGHPTYELLLSHSPLRPLEIYAVAAQHDIASLAQKTSAYLLSQSLSSIDDRLATKIGSLYLKKLFLLHLYRTEELKKMLSEPVHPHHATATCSFDQQKSYARAWTLAAAHLMFHCKPDVSSHMIQSVFGSVVDKVPCAMCKGSMNSRVRDIVVKWAGVTKCTI